MYECASSPPPCKSMRVCTKRAHPDNTSNTVRAFTLLYPRARAHTHTHTPYETRDNEMMYVCHGGKEEWGVSAYVTLGARVIMKSAWHMHTTACRENTQEETDAACARTQREINERKGGGRGGVAQKDQGREREWVRNMCISQVRAREWVKLEIVRWFIHSLYMVVVE